jgi:hypothetical protein
VTKRTRFLSLALGLLQYGAEVVMNARARAHVTTLAIALVLPGAVSAASVVQPTCQPSRIDSASYALTTRAVATAVTEPRHGWWDSFNLGKYEYDLYDLNSAVTRAAERALEIDANNLLAHQILARQYLVLGEPDLAQQAWSAVFAAGGAVAWTATLYDVDARTYFLVAFDRRGIRVYRFEQVVEHLKRGFYSIPEFPGPSDERFWAAAAGCVPAEIVPDAEVPWSAVREIKAGNWVLWFKLDEPVQIASDRTGKRKKLDEIKLNLHGRTGSLEVYKPVGEDHLAMRGRGPADYQDMVRRTLASFVDPEKRLELPPVKPGVGW